MIKRLAGLQVGHGDICIALQQAMGEVVASAGPSVKTAHLADSCRRGFACAARQLIVYAKGAITGGLTKCGAVGEE